MIFFLVSASVPIDIRAPSGAPRGTGRCAARRGLFTRALWIRGRCTATWRDYQRGTTTPKTTYGAVDAPEAGAAWRPPPCRVVGQTAGGASLRACCSVV